MQEALASHSPDAMMLLPPVEHCIRRLLFRQCSPSPHGTAAQQRQFCTERHVRGGSGLVVGLDALVGSRATRWCRSAARHRTRLHTHRLVLQVHHLFYLL